MQCAECGAALGPGESCQSKFHALLALEATVEGAPGAMPHFLAVATYGVQHPDSMGYTTDAVAGLRTQLAEALADTATIERVRRSVRKRVRGSPKIKRKAGDAAPRWPVENWPVTVDDVLRGGREHYVEGVERWARSVVAALDSLTIDTSEPERGP